MNNQMQIEITTDDRHIIKSVSMYSEQWAVVDEINERFDLRSVSHALRFIVNEYQRVIGQTEQTN